MKMKSSVLSETVFHHVMVGRWFGLLPTQAVWFALITALSWLLLNRHVFEDHLRFCGDNTEAARMMGIPVAMVRTGVFVLMGAILISMIEAGIISIGLSEVLKIIEELGGQVVAQEHCGGLKSIFRPIEKESDMLTALSDHYLGTPCACMSPNTRRLEFLLSLVDQFQVDAVVDATLQNCHPYTVEHTTVAETIENQCGIPILHVNTGYSPSDTEQIRVRVEAFLEMV